MIIVPARGGSKRIPRKNVAPLGGKPLLQYTLEQIAGAKCTDRAMVSTDDAEIAALSRAAGIRVIDRPAALASDDASTESVLLHALDVLEAEGTVPEWIMTLPPTSPLRTPATILHFLHEAAQVAPDVDCLFSVTQRLQRFWKKDPAGIMRAVFPDAPGNKKLRRERGEILYEENSAVYLTRVRALRAAHAAGSAAAIFSHTSVGIVIDATEEIDIDVPDDLRRAERLL